MFLLGPYEPRSKGVGKNRWDPSYCRGRLHYRCRYFAMRSWRVCIEKQSSGVFYNATRCKLLRQSNACIIVSFKLNRRCKTKTVYGIFDTFTSVAPVMACVSVQHVPFPLLRLVIEGYTFYLFLIAELLLFCYGQSLSRSV